MTASVVWVAGSVRARLLALRALGPGGAEALASAGSLAEALRRLGDGPYGRDVRPGMDVAAAERAVAATLLWHLRVLAGWLPRDGAEVMRVLAGWFEIRNVEDRLAALAGGARHQPFALGSLATAWRRVAAAPTVGALRAALGASPWGDPGTDDPSGIHLALRLSWAERVRRRVPEAARWAEAAAALAAVRELAAGRRIDTDGAAPPAARRIAACSSLEEALDSAPATVAWAIAGVHDLPGAWAAEDRWWSTVSADAAAMAGGPRHDRAVAVGASALLAADARRVRAALVAADRGAPPGGVGDAVA